MYKIHLYGDVISPPTPVFQGRSLFFASIVAAALFVLSLAAEVFISRVKASMTPLDLIVSFGPLDNRGDLWSRDPHSRKAAKVSR